MARKTRPYCPRTNELCKHHQEFECGRRWSRDPLPVDIGSEHCPGFIRDPMKARMIFLAESMTGSRHLFLDEAIRVLSMANRLDQESEEAMA